MKEKGLQGEACVIPVAVVAGLGIALAGAIPIGVARATDITSVTDTISVTVQPSCTFDSAEDKTYVGSALNGAEVNNFNEDGIHEFNLFCNNNSGYTVTATPYDLEATGINDVISYTANYTPSGVNSLWTAEITSDTEGVTVVNQFVPVNGGTIISSNSSTRAAGASFVATYSVYVGSETPAGTYTGTIAYTLAASGASNSGNNNVNTNNDGNGGSNEGSGSGESGTGDSSTSGSNPVNTNSGDTSLNNDPGDSANSELSNASPMLNNSYPTNNTYSTLNTYNTTNYSGGSGTSAPLVMNGSANSTTGGNENSSGANDNYEKPLGVTTSTLSNKNSGIDPMPIIATAGALAVAGVAAIVVARSNKEER